MRIAGENHTVSDVTILKKNKVEISFTDGSCVRISGDTFAINPVSVLDVLSTEQIEKIVTLSETEEAKKYAISLVSRKRYTRRKIKEKLARLSSGPGVLDSVLDELERLGLLDDRAYAADWIASRLQTHPEGKRNLYFGLLKKGIDKSIADSVVSETVTFDVELELAKKYLSTIGRPSMTKRERSAFLFKRGFSGAAIREALKEY